MALPATSTSPTSIGGTTTLWSSTSPTISVNKATHNDRETRYDRLMRRIIKEGVKTAFS